MKKAALILSAFLFIFVTGCSPKIPEGFTQEGYDTGVKALEAIDQYLDGEISEDSAQEKLDRLSDLLRAQAEAAKENGEEMAAAKLSRLMSTCSLISYRIGDAWGVDIGEILEERNEIAEELGKPAR